MSATKAKKEKKDYVEAQSLFEQARDGYELCLGADHATTLTMVTALAVLYEEQDNFDEARRCYEQALAGTERTKGLTHFKTLNIVRCLGNLLQNHGAGKLDEEAIEYYTRALAGYENTYGPTHAECVALRDTIARAKHRRELILKGEIDPDSAQDREERRHMRSSVFAVLTRKDSYNNSSLRRGGELLSTAADSSVVGGTAATTTTTATATTGLPAMMLLGTKSNSFSGFHSSAKDPSTPPAASYDLLRASHAGNGSSSVINSAINTARAALTMGSRNNSASKLFPTSLDGSSREKDKEGTTTDAPAIVTSASGSASISTKGGGP